MINEWDSISSFNWVVRPLANIVQKVLKPQYQNLSPKTSVP